MNQFLSLPKNVINNFELEASKSRFLGFAKYIETEEDATNFLNDLKKQYKDARHICYAYKLFNTSKASDDGEPSGTAGKPMLEIIDKLNLLNIIIVVVRYFGGVKLGAGRLLRTYSSCAIDTLKQNNVLWEKAFEKDLELNFSEYQELLKLKDKCKIKIINTEFSNKVFVKLCIMQELCINLGVEKSSKEVWEYF